MKYKDQIDGDILEVGNGVWRGPRRVLGKKWKGLDVRWETDEENKYWKASAENIPFPDCSHDWVLAFQTMEHWYEYGETPRQGIKEIHRILRPGGKFLSCTPIHYHGDSLFYFKDEIGMNNLFDFLDWKSVIWEPWRKEHEPLPRGMWWNERKNGNRRKKLKEIYGKPSTWQMEILAVKA